MTKLEQLRGSVAETEATLARARSAYRSTARRYLIALLLETQAGPPEIASLHLSAQYEYDDEGAYFRWLSGSVTLAPDAAEGDEFDDSWTEGLDVQQDVILELFGIDDVGEATLTAAHLKFLSGEGYHTPPEYGPQPEGE